VANGAPPGPDSPDEPDADPPGPADTPDAVDASFGGAGRPAGRATGTPRLAALLEAVLGIGTDLDLRTTLQRLVDTAAELTGARCAALGVIDPERGRVTEEVTATAGRQPTRTLSAPR